MISYNVYTIKTIDIHYIYITKALATYIARAFYVSFSFGFILNK